MEVYNFTYHQLYYSLRYPYFSKECGPWGSSILIFIWEVNQKPTCASYLLQIPFFFSCHSQEMNFLYHNYKQKVHLFQKTEQEVWPLKHFPLDQGDVEQSGGRKRRLYLSERAKTKNWSVWMMLSQASGWRGANPHTLCLAAVNIVISTSEWRPHKFLSVSFDPPGPKMNEMFSKWTSVSQAETVKQFLPVLRILKLVRHEFYYTALLGSVWTGDPGAEWGRDLNRGWGWGWKRRL